MFKELKLIKRSQEKSDDFYTNVTSTRLRYLLGRHDILRWINIVSLMKLIKTFYKHEYLLLYVNRGEYELRILI